MNGRDCGMIMLVLLTLALACDDGGRSATPDRGRAPEPASEQGDATPSDEARPVQEARRAPMKRLDVAVTPDISKRLSRFAPVAIDVDDELITDELRPVLRKLLEAAQVIDELYLAQVSSDNAELRAKLAADRSQAHALAYFDIMYGPWDRLEESEVFIGATKRPPGVSFYPEDLTADAFETYVSEHEDQREALMGYFSVIRRRGDELVAVPYSEAYREPLERAAQLLREAAEASPDERLTRYLRTRAEAFLSERIPRER